VQEEEKEINEAITAVKENLKLGKPVDQDYGLFTEFFSPEEKTQR